MRKLRINNERFSIRFCKIAENYGFKSIGKFEDFLINLKSPSVKLYFMDTQVRAARLLHEIEEFKHTKTI